MKSQSASQITDLDTICHQWRELAVIVNRAAGLVEFRHCHVPRKSFFFPKSQPSFACSITEIRAVHFTPQFKNNLAFLTVVTTTGKAIIPDKGTNFATLRGWLNEAVPRNDPTFASDNPLIGFAYILVGTVCFFTAAFLAEGAGNAAMCVAAVFGAILGVVATHFVVNVGGRLLNTDITYGIYSILIGVPIIAAVSFFYVDGVSFLSVNSILIGVFFATLLLKGRTRP